MNIVVISTVNTTKTFYELEFVRPITDIITEERNTFEVIHISNVTEHINEDKIIISGTAYQDNEFLKYKENMQHVFNADISVLGICAGAELLLPEDITLENVSEIGPLVVESLHEDNLTKELDGQKCYFLHQNGIRSIPLGNEEVVGLLATKEGVAAYRYKNKPIWGLQFHPEVDKKDLIRKFIKS